MLRMLTTTALALALLIAPTASATTVLKVTLPTMSVASHTIIHGTVKSARAIAVNGNERHIRTDVVIDIHSVIKGDKRLKTLTLELPGGRLGKWAMHIPGMPGFKDGEEVVLFLEKTANNWALTGLSQGKFSVVTQLDGRKLVRRKLDGIHFMARNNRGAIVAAEPPRDRNDQTLEDLLGEVRHAIRSVKKP